MKQRLLRGLAVCVLYISGTIFFTWPLATQGATHLLGHLDPPFSSWRLAWVARRLVHSGPPGTSFFDANIFWPARRTLAYSDATLVEGTLAVPLFAAGLTPAAVMNLLTLVGFAASGVAAYVLARRLTGHTGGALVAGAVFAFAPCRLDHLAHLELQWGFWMPLAYWAWHRTLDRGTFRDGLLCLLFVVLQLLSSIYYGLFLITTLPLLGLLSLLVRRWKVGWRSVAGLAAGAVVLAVVATAYGTPYRRVQTRVGDRSEAETRRYSATLASFVSTRPDNRLYGATGGWTYEENRLFPGVTPVLLAGAALIPPVSPIALVYGGLLAFSVESAFGLNGHLYPVLRAWVPPFRGLRAPARFGALIQLALGVLAAFGIARVAERRPRHAAALTTVSLALLAVEYAQRPMTLMEMTPHRPPLYDWLAKQPPGTVTIELPLPTPTTMPRLDPLYMYNSTWHWQPLVNGYSGHYYPPYVDLLAELEAFPGDAADAALERAGVQILIVHRSFIEEDRYEPLIAKIEANPRFRLMTIANDQFDEARAYAFLPGYGSCRAGVC